MERYDAILEQLKKAQGRGLETITNRLDFVVQSLEELIQEAKSSVQGALPESADELLPLDEVAAELERLRHDAEGQRQRADELEARVADLESAAASGGAGLPLGVLRSLDGARSQSELLRELLPVLSEHAARAVVLVLREGSVAAWSGIGFADGELLRGWQGDAGSSPALVEIQGASAPVAFDAAGDPLFGSWFGDEGRPEEALLVPVVLRGRLMGAIYVDRLDGQPWNPAAAQTLVMLVCLLIDTLVSRSGPAAMLAEPVTVEAAAEPAGAEAEGAAEAFGLAGEDPSATIRVDLAETRIDEGVIATEAAGSTDEVEAEVVSTAAELEPEETTASEEAAEGFEAIEPETAEPDFEGEVEPEDAGWEPEAAETEAGFEPETAEPDLEGAEEPADAGWEPEAAETEAGFEPEEPLVAAGFEPEAAELEAEPEPAPTQVEVPDGPPAEKVPAKAPTGFLDEPPPVKPVQPPPDEPEVEISEDEAQREEARRFARLLVSEIKLYNEEQVERGREAHDIYRRLQEDIDRSREMFEKRIAPEVRAKQDFFQDELVRILADGNPDRLGM
ncbi:MAG TPA: hypothetical protein VLT32_02570 [Candidatus Sulfomarinibacteraceae bacterium]|nr:hypothetical protein [Candidatus Sulfomarinibacteraceae bacterium]